MISSLRFAVVFGATVVASQNALAQKLEIVTSQQAEKTTSSSAPEIFLLVVLALVVGAVVAWLLRGKVKIAEEAAYQPYQSAPRHLNRRKPKKAKAVVVDETAERDRVLSQLNQVVEGTKDDIRYLPIFNFRSIPEPTEREPLSEIDDPQVDLAITHSNEEVQPDTGLRQDAVEILASYRTPRSIEALAQVAVYDLSSSLRSLALSTLASFDHGSVFEPIVIACADPTREVRAAASRALSKLTFSRADEWFRIAASEDLFTVRQCARAAIAAGLHTATFGRLINRERNAVLEAFAIVCVLIRAGETADLIDAVMNHPDAKVASALLHIIQLTGDHSVLRELATAAETFEVRPEIRPQIDKIFSQWLGSDDERPSPGEYTPDKTNPEIAQIHAAV